MIEINDFGMNNRTAPLAAEKIVRLAKNGVHFARGRFRKRYGIATAVTVNLQIGHTPPFRLVPWKPASTAYLVAVGAECIAFVNPWNKYLYWRAATAAPEVTGTDAKKYTCVLPHLSAAAANKPVTGAGYAKYWVEKGSTGGTWVDATWYAGGGDGAIASAITPTYVDTEWGLAAPTGGTTSADGTTKSVFAAGFYLIGVASVDETRRVSSPLRKLTSSSAGATDKGQPIAGPGWSITLPGITKDAKASHVYYYRTRGLTYSSYIPASSWSHARYVNKSADGTWTPDSGDQGRMGVFLHATDVVPACTITASFDDRQFYASGLTIYYSNKGCPETYAGSEDSALAEAGENLVQGKAILVVPPDCGDIVALTARGDILLVLCQYGCWMLARGGNLGEASLGLPESTDYHVLPDAIWIGCVSQASLAHSPVGDFWLSAEGIVLWPGGTTAPAVITQEILDPTDADTLFATDLSTACATYDLAERQYVVVVPKSGEGQFALTVRGDRLPQEVILGTWTFATSLATVTGIGYDPANRRVVFLFGTNTVTAKAPTSGTYAEGDPDEVTGSDSKVYQCIAPHLAVAGAAGNKPITGSEWATYWTQAGSTGGVWAAGTTYATGDTYGMEAEAFDGEIDPETKPTAAIRLFAHRSDTTHAQTVNAQVQSLKTDEEATLPAASALTWAIGETQPKAVAGTPIAGRIVRVRLVNTDPYAMEFRALQIGTLEEIRNAEKVPA